MISKENEKNLGAMMNSDLVDSFTNQVDQRGHKIKRALAAAVKLWIELPEEIQARLLNQSMSASAFIELVQELVDRKFEDGRRAGKALAERLKRSKIPKD